MSFRVHTEVFDPFGVDFCAGSGLTLPHYAGEDVEKEKHSSIVGGIASLYNHSGNQSGGSSEN